ncbi:hypothetical protein Prudu_866S000200 [Prunus dulcis]|uniref:Uncharacterized protein n=1 Tax=Prunus dulcis TaxID=3755 RepID=A0A5H2XTA5_PRUDU|nr:hypothetical protein Prudu_866S000200 [Prunus dulcis]
MTGFYEAIGLRLYLYSDENIILNTGRRSTRDPPPGPFKASATPRKVKILDWSKYRGDSAEIFGRSLRKI